MTRMGRSLRRYLVPVALIATLAVVAGVLVRTTLRRPEVPEYPVTSARPAEVGSDRVGPRRYTVDATDDRQWRRFDFSRGSVVERAGYRGWDLAFRRHEILVNAAPAFQGRGGARAIEDVAFDSLLLAPGSGYRGTIADGDTTSPAFEGWYEYGFTSHLLEPRPRVYAIRTADGRFAKLEILSYYCPGARSGCITFRYVYQGDGSRRFVPARKPVEPS